MCAGHGLRIMSIGVSVGKKIKILKHCIEYVCTLLRWIYIDCSDGPLLGSAVGQLACDRGPKGREYAKARRAAEARRAQLEARRAETIRSSRQGHMPRRLVL